MKPLRVGILTTHPVQYQVPWFRSLSTYDDLDVKVYYCFLPDKQRQGQGFEQSFQWDIPLLDGYNYEVLSNCSTAPTSSVYNGCDTPQIKYRIRDGQFDAFIIHGWHVKSCLQALRACKRYGIPCLARGESNAIRKRPFWKRVLHQLHLSRYDAFLTIGQSNTEFYQEHGVNPKKMFFAPYCVDNDFFYSHADALLVQRSALRARWDITPDDMVFVWCGKFEPKKHPMELIETVEQATKHDSHIRLLMVGDGQLKSICQTYVEEHKLPVIFTGFLNQREISQAYAAAACLVLPSDEGETWGLVVNEAMACGRPAIVSDRVGCGPDLITHETGAIFPFGNREALTQLMLQFASNRDRTRQMGEAARKRVSDYSIKAASEATRQAIESVARNRVLN